MTFGVMILGAHRRVCRGRLWRALVVALTIGAWAGVAGAAEPPALTPLLAGCEFDYPPFSIVHEDGRVDGFSVELLRAALAKMGREVTFRTGPWSEVRGWLERGDVDALPLVGRTPEREALFDFTVPYMTMHGAIVVRAETTDVHTLDDLRGRRVGVMAGDNAEEFLRREDRGFEIVATPTFADAFRALAEGRCDAVVVQRLVAIRLLQETGLDRLRIGDRPVHDFSQAFCFAVKKGDSETLALLNEGLALVVADGTHRRLHAKWFAAMELPADRPIVIGGDHNYPPFEFLDEKGRPTGYNVDLVRAVAEATGLDIRIRLGSWNEMMQALERGELDAIQGMFYSPERGETFDFSQAHLVNHCVAVIRKEDGSTPATVADLAGKRIVVQAGDIMHEFCRQNGLTNHLAVVDSQEIALRELAGGKHDCALVARMTAFYWIEQAGWDNLAVGNKSLASPEYGFAVPHGSRALLAQLSEGLTAISNAGEYRRIHEKWMGVYDDRFALGYALKYGALVAGPLLLIALLALLWSWGLRRQVAARTRELRASTQELARQNNLLESIFEVLPIGLWLTDREGTLLRGNPAGVSIWGAEPKVPISEYGVFKAWRLPERTPVKADEWALARTIREGVTVVDELLEIEAFDGKRKTILNYTAPVLAADGKHEGAIVVNLDVSDRLALEARLQQAQRLESVGRLAGGVAHDFNNLLMGIMGYADLCRADLPENHPVREWLDAITREAERSATLTRQLLAFARKQTVAPKVLDLNDTVENLLNMLRRLIGEDIDLVWQPGAALWSVKLDPGQLDQILMNLCVNARDAIDGAGHIVIETGNVSIDADYCADHAEAAPGTYVTIAVSDDGCGMDRETLANIFEPFFTTKGIGKGTGLGLATVYGIVRQNNGFVNVYSEPGAGTSFRIYLPRVEDATVEAAEPARQTVHEGGTETILLVEDEPSIRVTTGIFLKQLGYRVVSAESPAEALQKVATVDGTPDLLITDVVMPGMNGRELARRLDTIYPGLKVLYMSGYTANVIVHQGILEEGVQFMSKPIGRDDLARKVREVLG